MATNPKFEYLEMIDDSGKSNYINRLLVGTPATGLIRIEWYMSRVSLITPPNWSQVAVLEAMRSYMPSRYEVADAQNLIVKKAVEGEFGWLLLLEHDNLLPMDALIRFNEYMISAEYPVISGLYYTRSRPSEPSVFMGPGRGTFRDFKIGDLLWCWGVPTGSLLINVDLLRAMWDESPEYYANGRVTRRVFETARLGYEIEGTGQVLMESYTSDLNWCERVQKGNYFHKSGWNKFADEHPECPFLVDTNILVKHINQDGEIFP